MKTLLALPALALLLSACTGHDRMADEADRVDVISIEAVVQTVDMESRQVLLSGETGETVVVTASPEVRNLDKINPGDAVVLAYYQAVSLRMADPDMAPATMSVAGAARAPEGDMPGAMAKEVTVMIVDFIDYNGETNVTRFVDSTGKTRFATVQPEMRAFAATRKRGDKVEVTIEEAVAVGIEPAAM